MAYSTQLRVLGYEVVATLGYGARSTIFAVRDRTNQVYALKRVVKQEESDQRFLNQAVIEHEVAQQFDHPTLRRSFKLYRQRGLIRVKEIYVLMELVEGDTLEHHQTKDMVELLRICQHIALGLKAMHDVGYVHADMKPSNVLITPEGKVKIIDFGQSCASGTVKQRIQGTPDYIAPEQVLRQAISPQTDVFNLGATMYWLLTRQHVPTLLPRGKPGLGLRTEETCRAPEEINPQIPPALSSLVMHCIAREPSDRPSSMVLVHDRLELAINQFLNKLNPPAKPTTNGDTAVHDALDLSKELSRDHSADKSTDLSASDFNLGGHRKHNSSSSIDLPRP